MSVLVSNIQKMSLMDGPGLQTVVFLMGCSLHCPWCSNPENLTKKKKTYFSKEKCIRNNGGCPFEDRCGISEDNMPSEENMSFACPIQAVGVYGKEYSEDELLEILLRDRIYWGNKGGVTFSGGEALLWANELKPVLQRLKKERVLVTLETSLFAPIECVKVFLDYCNLFYVDVKILDKEICLEVLGGKICQYYSNIDYLFSSGAQIVFRVPCSDKYTLSEKNMSLLYRFFDKYKGIPIEVFGIHSLGDAKYRTLGLEVPEKLECTNISILISHLLENGHKVKELII